MYSQNQLEKIKSLVNSYFTDPEVKSSLRSIIKQDQLNLQELDDSQLIELLKKANLMDKLLVDLENIQEVEQYNKNLKTKMKTSEKIESGLMKSRGIGLKILDGKAFVEYIQNFDPTEKFIIDLNFLHYRYRTQAVQVSHEPKFNEEFIFDFDLLNEQKTVDLLNLARLESQIEVVLLILKPDGSKRVYSIKQLEWRFVLAYGKVSLNIELAAFESNTSLLNNLDSRKKNSVGVLQIEMDLYPKGNIQYLPERLLNEQLSKERKYKDVDTIAFYEYSSEWWNDFKQIQNTFEKRSIKIYAETEDGVFKPVTTFIKPLYSINGIDSPYHAARFVSLIPIKRREKPGGEKMEVWHRFHTFISSSGGDYEDHANLLCSLLLGFGLDAYVLIGTSTDGPHNWVLTRSIVGTKAKLTFWESLTGQRYDQKDPRVNNLYRKIGCSYNHKSFYGNIQNNDSGYHSEFDFENPRLWKKMSEDKISLIPCFQSDVSLLHNPKNPFFEEKRIENELKLHIGQFRKTLSINYTKFDDTLAHILTTALTNYEHERITGQNFGIEEFQNAIRNYISDNHTFKAFPIQFLFDDSTKIFNKLKSAPICEDILKTRGDQVNFGIKCKMVIYPDDIYVVWISIAVRYFSLD